MALLFTDSFDHYATADLLLKWTNYSATPGAITSGAGRHSSSGYRATSANHALFKALTPGDNTFVVGVAYKCASLPGTQADFIRIYDSAGRINCSFEVTAAGLINANRGSSGQGSKVLLGTTTGGALTTSIYSYIEVKGFISDTVGTIDVHVNGVSVLSLSGLDTRDSAGLNSWGQVYINPNVNGGNSDIDDVYICDGTGSFNNSLLGDVRVDAVFPNANGTTSGSTPSTGTDRFATVDEASQNGDTDYNSFSSTGKDTLNLQSLPAAGAEIKGFQVVVTARKTDGGAAQIRPVIRHSGTDYNGTAVGLSSSYTMPIRQAYDVNPGTSAAITESEFNALEAGYERTA